MRQVRFAVSIFIGTVTLCAAPARVSATDVSTSRKTALLKSVVRVAVMPPYFGTETLERAAVGDPKTAERITTHPDEILQDPAATPALRYAAQLSLLQSRATDRLPRRLSARTAFLPVPPAEISAYLKNSNRIPRSLFEPPGRIKSGKFPLPSLKVAREAAAALHADAILLCVLDEPRRSNGRYYWDPLSGFNYESGSARAKGAFYLLSADGTEVLHMYAEALQPLTKIGDREFVTADWQEAQDLMIEDFLDELTRYAPSP